MVISPYMGIFYPMRALRAVMPHAWMLKEAKRVPMTPAEGMSTVTFVMLPTWGTYLPHGAGLLDTTTQGTGHD